MYRLISSAIILALSGCAIPSVDLSQSSDYSHIVGQCYELVMPTFVFEGRCADLNGFNDNSELCNSIQAQGLGDFPADWDSYLGDRSAIDKQLFDRLALEPQRSMLFPLQSGTKLYISRLVHHGWGVNGRYWVMRGEILHDGSKVELELPSFSLVHKQPFWLDGNDSAFPGIDSRFLVPCKQL